MTTIATDGKSMAGDGQRELGGTIVYSNAEKVQQLADGRIIGTAGDTGFGLAIVDWLEGRADKPAKEPEQGFSALVLAPGGKVSVIDRYGVELPVLAPAAVGSGMDFAIGAMEAGISPEASVRIAARRDPNTGGKITVITL